MSRVASRGVVGLVGLVGALAVVAGCDARRIQAEPQASKRASAHGAVALPVSTVPGDALAVAEDLHPPGTVPPPPPPEVNLFDERLYVTSVIDDPVVRAQVEYGRALAEETWRCMGHDVVEKAMRVSGNGLACKNCHIKAGLQPHSAPWMGVTKTTPGSGVMCSRHPCSIPRTGA